MKGLIVDETGKLFIVNDVPMPETGDYDCLVKTIACGICAGTDTKIIQKHFKGYAGYPCVLGHESCGEVVKIGSKVRNYKVGDRVLRSMLVDTEKYYSGWGSFAEYGFVTDYWAMDADGIKNIFTGHMAQQIVPGDIDPEKAVMLITFKEVFSALKRFGIASGMEVMVNGCGPVGLTMVNLMKAMGVGRIVASDINEKRLAIAKEMGADDLINAAKGDVEAKVKQIVPKGLDVFVDAVGRNELMNLGLNLIKFNGKVAVYGISPKCSAEIDWEKAPYNWDIHFVQWPTFEEEAAAHDEVVKFVREGRLNLDRFVSDVFDIDDFEKGFDIIKNGDCLKVALKF
jgi:threonine dehydrogenase-like Zn-dependent dehydrogenase